MMSLGRFLLVVSVALGYGYPWLEQIARQEQILRICDNFQNVSSLNYSELDHVLVDHGHKLLYCYVPKVACTNWKRVFMMLTGRSNVSNLVDIPATLAHNENSTISLSELPQTDASHCLDDYLNFLMVRHPFERLLSAYRNKFEDSHPSAKYFQERYGRYIIKKYRKHAAEHDLKTGCNVSFREFVQYLINEGLTNEHWKSIFELCRPCSVNYTFIGKYEKFEEDSQALLDMVGAPYLVFPHTRSGGTSDVLRKYYQQLSLGEIERLYRLYEFDFKMFGYDLENILGFDIG